MSDRAPLVPAEVDLHDFGFMPLDVRRLLTSETWIEAAEDPRLGHALMSLWAEAWHQVPAGSLPDNDLVLQRFSMCPNRKEWLRVRERALSGWIKCSDGLLYHPVVAEKALESWAKKLAQRDRTKAATEAREEKRRHREDERNVIRDVDVRATSAQRDVHQGTGTVKGQGVVGEVSPTTPLGSAAPPRCAEKRDETAAAKRILAYLNERTKRQFQPVEASLKFIRARLREGATEDLLRRVIDRKVDEWMTDPEKSQYLRPETLFNATKFASYAGQLETPKAGEKPWWETAPGIEAKGKELGVALITEEGFPRFRQRVYQAAGDGPWSTAA